MKNFLNVAVKNVRRTTGSAVSLAKEAAAGAAANAAHAAKKAAAAKGRGDADSIKGDPVVGSSKGKGAAAAMASLSKRKSDKKLGKLATEIKAGAEGGRVRGRLFKLV